MKTRAVLALAAVAGLATVASAQETVTFTLKFGSATINEGDSNNVQVFAEFAPGVGATAAWKDPPGTGQVGSVVAFASSIFDLLVTQGGGLGAFQVKGSGKYFEVAPSVSIAGKFQGDLVGTDIVNIGPGQAGFTLDGSNPILLGTATWLSTGGVGNVNMNTKVTSGPKVYLDVGLPVAVPQGWAAVNISGGFNVIPAPASLALLGLGGLVAARRRR